jgi:phosphate transport system permease protein
MQRKFIEERIFIVIMQLATLLIALSLVLILASILLKGLPSMSWSMVSETPDGGYYMGKGGGVLNAIVGSLYLAGGATVIAFFMSIPVVLYLNVYRKKKSKFASFTRLCLDVLWGIPSIVYGAFAFSVMTLIGLKVSLLAGMLTVALLIIPIMIRAMDEVIRTTPQGLLDASYSLGATRFETAIKVVIKQGMPGIITAILISFGRGVGDAASVMFTAGYSDYLPESFSNPVATLPLAIFFQLGTPIPEVQQRAYASALILTIIILLISISTRFITKRYLKNKIS